MKIDNFLQEEENFKNNININILKKKKQVKDGIQTEHLENKKGVCGSSNYDSKAGRSGTPL